jgi:hypothetical protein
MSTTRRQFLRTATLLPLVVIALKANAQTNATVRKQLKYQDHPKNDMNCTSCLEFIPGKSDKDLGGCRLIPGDNEISPDGYCIKWNSM